ncbi:hypothetical protein [Halobacteriaceae bacterium SHR40]|uniref:hypothetical protein n=1 Tax=Halovenus amylolytica TaxID=2500550 RepID=UPI000FE43F1D
MQHDSSTTGDHVSLLIDQPALPDDEPRRETLLADLEAAVEAVLADHGLHADALRTFGGHTYTSIDADCPQCGDRLPLIEPTLDASNGAVATAACECGWRGDAIYRLIDFHETPSQATADGSLPDEETPVDILEESSSVRLDDIKPTYTPY